MGRIMINNLDEFAKIIKVRNIELDDYEAIKKLQLRCFPGMQPWDKEQVESQINIFKEGQFCVEYEGEIIASATSLIIDFNIYSDFHSWAAISDSGYIRNHNEEGDTLYGIEIMVDPDFRGMKLARRLYETRK